MVIQSLIRVYTSFRRVMEVEITQRKQKIFEIKD